MKITIDINAEDLFFIDVPETCNSFQICNYGYAGAYLVETSGYDINAWKIKLPSCNYEILGFTKDVLGDKKINNLGNPIGNFVLRRL